MTSSQPLSNIRSLKLATSEECFTLSSLIFKYKLSQLEAVVLPGAPSPQSLRALLTQPSMRYLSFPWTDELIDAGPLNLQEICRLELANLTSTGNDAVRSGGLNALRHCALRHFEGSYEDVLCLLDAVPKGQLRSFELTTLRSKLLGRLEEIVHHPALCNLEWLVLGMPDTQACVREVANMDPLANLSFLSFIDEEPERMQERPAMPEEEQFLEKWAQAPVFGVSYPRQFSGLSILSKALNRGEESISLAGSHYQIIPKIERGRVGQGTYFLQR